VWVISIRKLNDARPGFRLSLAIHLAVGYGHIGLLMGSMIRVATDENLGFRRSRRNAEIVKAESEARNRNVIRIPVCYFGFGKVIPGKF